MYIRIKYINIYILFYPHILYIYVCVCVCVCMCVHCGREGRDRFCCVHSYLQLYNNHIEHNVQYIRMYVYIHTYMQHMYVCMYVCIRI